MTTTTACEDSGHLQKLEENSGTLLWLVPTNVVETACPETRTPHAPEPRAEAAGPGNLPGKMEGNCGLLFERHRFPFPLVPPPWSCANNFHTMKVATLTPLAPLPPPPVP